MIRMEFHCHTHYSVDSLVKPADLVAQARRIGLDRVAITDHNSIRGALEAQQLDPELVVIGEEIQTTRGELLAYFVTEEVPAGLSPQETLERLKSQGAVISVSHPFDPQRSGWSLQDLLFLVGQVDALEVFNSRCLSAGMNRRAAEFARQHGLPGTVGSDAHSLVELGRSTLRLPPFQSAGGMRSALAVAEMEVNMSSVFIHLTSSWARLVKRLRRRTGEGMSH